MEGLRVDSGAAIAPYEQVRVQLAAQVAAGALPAGARLPTVRALAAQLGLAVNTVARAYRMLETDGLVVTEGRRGTFVSPSAAASSADALVAAEVYAGTARRLGLTLAEANHLVERAW